MELFDSITNILSLLFGGSLISVLTWKFARRKAAADAKKAEAEAKQAEAEAKQAEAEAKKAEAEALKEKQDYYQQLIDNIASDRDYYKGERDELRQKLDSLTQSVIEWKKASEDERMKMKRDINNLQQQLDFMKPKLCGRDNCALRIPVDLSDLSVTCVKKPTKKTTKKDIEPIENKDI